MTVMRKINSSSWVLSYSDSQFVSKGHSVSILVIHIDGSVSPCLFLVPVPGSWFLVPRSLFVFLVPLFRV